MAPRSKSLADLVEAHQVVERVVERAQVGVDLLRQIAGQETESLAGLDRRAGQHDALHQFALDGVDRRGHGEIGLAGAGRAGAEGDVVLLDVLAGTRPGAACGRAARSCASSASATGCRCAESRRTGRLSSSIRPSWISSTDSVVPGQRVEHLQRLGGARRLRRFATQREALAAPGDDDIERGFDLAQILVERAAQIGQLVVVDRREHEFDWPRSWRAALALMLGLPQFRRAANAAWRR